MNLRIEKAIYGGAGLARDEGKAVFVPFTLPDELVEAHINEDRSSYANAELDSVLEASPERVTAACPYFGECGGCHYQHAKYAAQVEMKVEILRESLERAHLKDIPPIFAVQGEPFGYRNRIRLHVDQESSMLGYRRRASHSNLEIDECPIAAPVLEEALRTVQLCAGDWRLGGSFDEVEFFMDADQSTVMVTLWSGRSQGEAAQDLQQLWPRVVEVLPQVKGAAVLSSGRAKVPGAMLALCGQPALTYRAAGEDYRVSLGSFFQVNRFLIDSLVELVVMDRSGETAWDLYAGVGLFARALSSRFGQVIAVEGAAPSVRDLRENLGGGAHRVVAASTLEFLRKAKTARQAMLDFVVVDPPRAGLGKDVAALLGKIRPRHITYVSCDPATLSRDLKSLGDSGYQLTKLHMVDLFPQTYHLESVAMLSL